MEAEEAAGACVETCAEGCKSGATCAEGCAEELSAGTLADDKSYTEEMTVTSYGDTSKPAFLSFLILYDGVDIVSLCESEKLSHKEHDLPLTQGSSSVFFSLQRAQHS